MSAARRKMSRLLEGRTFFHDEKAFCAAEMARSASDIEALLKLRMRPPVAGL